MTARNIGDIVRYIGPPKRTGTLPTGAETDLVPGLTLKVISVDAWFYVAEFECGNFLLISNDTADFEAV